MTNVELRVTKRGNNARGRRGLSLYIFAVSLLAFSSPSVAHDVNLTKVSVTFSSNDAYQVDIYYDVNAWVIGVRPEHLTPAEIGQLGTLPAEQLNKRLDALRDHVLRSIRVRFDEQKVTPAVAFVDNPERPATRPEHGSALLRIVRLSGKVPLDTKVFDFWASRSFGNIVLMVWDSRASMGDSRPRLSTGDDSQPAAAVPHLTQQLLERGERSRPYELTAPTKQSGWNVARQYLALGFEHILPWGPDHILFVFGLFLLDTRLGPLLWQVTAFTLAHSVSLALSTYGVISVSPRIVEPLIALSIACVAIENVCTSKLHAWRPVVVFVFGLLHGLGFAGVLTELELPRDQFATALVSFNVGVELGQITVIAIALLAVGWFRNRTWYRSHIAVPCSLLIAAVGLYWTVERTLA